MTLNVQGELIENAPLGVQSWFRCGGTADLLFKPADVDDLAEFLKQWPLKKDLTILGGLANTIIRDGGIRGAVVQLGKSFANVQALDDQYIEVGCGALNGSIAAAAVKSSIGGLEFLSGIPGSFGGALAMNAGAYGAEVKDVLIGVNALTRSGELRRLARDDLKMSYRKTETEEQIQRRIAVAAKELEMAHHYQHIVKNEEIQATANQICGLLKQTGE